MLTERLNNFPFSRKKNLRERYFGFPEDMSYEDFLKIPDQLLREKIIANNRILQTDSYNRTMEHVKGKDWKTDETYVLQLRNAPNGYLITCGIRRELERLLQFPISKGELNFADDFYRHHSNIRFFNREKWDWVINKHKGYPPLSIDCLPEGTAVLPGDPVLRVSGPGELAAHWEPNWHRIFYPSLVATEAHQIGEKIGPNRFIEVGKRGSITEEDHLIASSAMYVGGGLYLTSNDSAAATYSELRDTGTIGHRFVQFYVSEREAFEQAINSLEAVSLLVDLNNTRSGIEIALDLKRKYRNTGKKIWIRLDSGDITKDTLYALKRQKELGFTDSNLDKIVVEDLTETKDMELIDKALSDAGFDPRKYILYGAGELLIGKDKTRSKASSGFKLSKHHEDIATMKKSDSPGKQSFPGTPTLSFINGKRSVTQIGEYASGDMFVPAYRPGRIILEHATLESAHNLAKQTMAQISKEIAIRGRSEISPQTRLLITQISQQYANKGGEIS